VSQRQEEFERTALPHLRSLLRFARRLSGNLQTAEDLVQETYLQAWRGFDRFETGTNIRAWLFRILLNTQLQQARRARPEPVESRPDDSLVQRLELLQALDRLPEDHRTVLLLGVVEGFTSREIAGILSIPIGTVMSRLSRAREAMRAILSQKCEKVSQ
jgi:RNA polymerase sigma-70 factor (ECF subfamily)